MTERSWGPHFGSGLSSKGSLPATVLPWQATILIWEAEGVMLPL